jgi:Ala-tRNA(Pro) deacylase
MGVNPRLQKLLDETWSSYAVLPHSEVFTAQEVAQSVHVPGRQLAKVLVLRARRGEDLMVVLPASEQFDPLTLEHVVGRSHLRLEDERELLRLFPDCELGAMPPFGRLYGMRMIVDPCLLQGEDFYFQAGNHREVVLMRTQDYQRIAQPFSHDACVHAVGALLGGD